MQFIKELQKTKSLKSLQAGHHHHPTSKSYADNLKQIAGKTLA